ncbi:MAG: PHP domain-containing protein [Clostridia bacterium]|nr:PHP domain-containing protein [Clostridia bacterium]
MKLKLDMHVHTEKSFDCLQTVEEIAAACKEKGLDGVCICDHFISREEDIQIIDGVLIIPGVELNTNEGHMLGYCTEGKVEVAKTLDEAIDNIKAANGIAVLAHPFERVIDPAEVVEKRLDRLAPKLDGIEVENGRADMYVYDANKKARAQAKIRRMRTFGGSDAHFINELGNAYTELEIDCESLSDITLEKLRSALLENGADAYLAKRSKHINSARSQYIRRKKSGASLKVWCKYWLYALKCVAYDMGWQYNLKCELSDKKD